MADIELLDRLLTGVSGKLAGDVNRCVFATAALIRVAREAGVRLEPMATGLIVFRMLGGHAVRGGAHYGEKAHEVMREKGLVTSKYQHYSPNGVAFNEGHLVAFDTESSMLLDPTLGQAISAPFDVGNASLAGGLMFRMEPRFREVTIRGDNQMIYLDADGELADRQQAAYKVIYLPYPVGYVPEAYARLELAIEENPQMVGL